MVDTSKIRFAIPARQKVPERHHPRNRPADAAAPIWNCFTALQKDGLNTAV